MKKASATKMIPYTPNPNKELSPPQRDELLDTLAARFEQAMHRHEGLAWTAVRARLEANPAALWSLNEMERTGGEPDVIGQDSATGAYLFVDCAPESPEGRRSTCFDPPGQAEREKKGVYPTGSAVGMAAAMGIELLNEEAYRDLQRLGPFDTKTSSWLQTPADVHKRGGAIFGDYRYGRIFIYHNSTPSFYSSRGFRGLLRV